MKKKNHFFSQSIRKKNRSLAAFLSLSLFLPLLSSKMLRHAATRALAAASSKTRIHESAAAGIRRAWLANDASGNSNNVDGDAYSSPSTSSSSSLSSSSWMPSFLKRRLPAALGGDRLSGDLSFEEFITSLSRARKLGGLAGSAFGTTAVDSAGARGALKRLEDVAAAIPPHLKTGADVLDPRLFGPEERRRAAEAAGVPVAAVDDLLRKFEVTREMAAEVARRHRAGEKLPQSIEELEAAVGSNWTKKKSVTSSSSSIDSSCPLAGSLPGRNTKCPKTKKAYKNCCGR